METIGIDEVLGRRSVLPDSGADERLARLAGLGDAVESVAIVNFRGRLIQDAVFCMMTSRSG